MVLTEFKETTFQPYYPYESNVGSTVIAVSVTCLNRRGGPFQLLTTPIQMIDSFQRLVNEIPVPRLLSDVYDASSRLRFTSPSSGSVYGLVEDFHALERQPWHSHLYIQRFTSVSLPSNVSTSWTQYYPISPYASGPLKILLRGQDFTEAVSLQKNQCGYG